MNLFSFTIVVMYPKDADGIANSVDLIRLLLSDLGIHCLLRPICYNTWLQGNSIQLLCFLLQTNGYVHESAESKVKRLETDKQGLMLQVSVLTEQVEAQAEKLREMEYDVEGKRQKIRTSEEMYQSVSNIINGYFT